MIGFIVDRMHVSVSDRALIREFRGRYILHSGVGDVLSREYRAERHRVYREALKRHHDNQKCYAEVMRGGF